MRLTLAALTLALALSGCTDKPCSTVADCDDGIFCNGASACVFGRCTVTTLPNCDDGVACTRDRCSNDMASCLHEGADVDDDGYWDVQCLNAAGRVIGNDCDDSDATRYPGNREVCDTHDEDCDPVTLGGRDLDRDGFVDVACTNPLPDAGVSRGTDCNDANEGVHAGQLEACNGFDDNCNGMIDEGVTAIRYGDADHDGFGAGAPRQGCPTDPSTSAVSGDCDDTNPAMRPGQFICASATQYQMCGADGGFGLAQNCTGQGCRPQPNGTGICI
jgi:Putative metal-binding motif